MTLLKGVSFIRCNRVEISNDSIFRGIYSLISHVPRLEWLVHATNNDQVSWLNAQHLSDLLWNKNVFATVLMCKSKNFFIQSSVFQRLIIVGLLYFLDSLSAFSSKCLHGIPWLRFNPIIIIPWWRHFHTHLYPKKIYTPKSITIQCQGIILKKKIQSINLVSIFYRWFQQQPRDKKARFCATNIHRIENHLAIRNNKEKTWILKYKSSGPWVFIVWTRKDGMQATFWWIDMYDNFVLWEIEFAHFTHAKSTAACQRSALFVYKGRWFFFCCCATKCGLDRSVCLNL